MIEIKKSLNNDEIREYFTKYGLKYNDNSQMILAKSGDEPIGFCLFYVCDKSIKLAYCYPDNDLMLLDGLVRSVLHFASENLIEEAYFTDTAPIEQLKKLGFIDDLSNKTLKMLGLLGNCENCNK